MRRLLALSLSVLIVIPGCVSYTFQPPPVPGVVTMPFSRIENSVIVAVDPYIQSDRQEEVFDRDLKKLGVLPLYLLVENRGDRELSLDRAAIVLELPDGRQIGRLDATAAAPKFVSVSFPLGLFLHSLGTNPVTIPVALLFLPVIRDAQKSALEALRTDYMNTELRDVVLDKDASAHGFVYFLPPSGTLWYGKARLAQRFVNKTDGTSFVIRLPVSESKLFKKGPIDTKQAEPTS